MATLTASPRSMSPTISHWTLTPLFPIKCHRTGRLKHISPAPRCRVELHKHRLWVRWDVAVAPDGFLLFVTVPPTRGFVYGSLELDVVTFFDGWCAEVCWESVTSVAGEDFFEGVRTLWRGEGFCLTLLCDLPLPSVLLRIVAAVARGRRSLMLRSYLCIGSSVCVLREDSICRVGGEVLRRVMATAGAVVCWELSK